ncbi:chorismate mutase [Paenarthrobacter sp. NPDC018779]|uniref:chorismate mutase n=1 Tax=Paenarthrobacter sp. NPDC018779 TaxID=3364375 RepID=UPI0037C80BA4
MGIESIRAEIDELDRQIVGLVARRQQWVVEAGKLKANRAAMAAFGEQPRATCPGARHGKIPGA